MSLGEGAAFADEARRLLAAARRDRAGLEAAYRRYVGSLYVFCALRTRDRSEAENVVHSALRRAEEEIARAQDLDRPLLPWLFALATDRFQRRRGRRGRPSAPRVREAEQTMADVRRLVGEIGDHTAAALVLVLMEGLSTDEVAAALDIRREETQRLIFRAVVKVARRLEAGHEA